MIAVEAAMEGAGVAVGPPQLFREELAEGRLFQPFPQIVDIGKAWWFVCPPASASRPEDPRLRGMADRGTQRTGQCAKALPHGRVE